MKSILIIALLYCFCQHARGQVTGRNKDTTRAPQPDTIRVSRLGAAGVPLKKRADTVQLKEVVIRAVKPLYQQSMAGMVINVDSSVLTKGSSALEVLERSPGVVIDHQNNDISLNGKSGVMVMVDGKLMRMPMDELVTWLNAMSADDIEKVELMNTPPAQYDAEGSAGIINIVMKKNKRVGTTGSISLTGGYGWGEKGTASINLAHNTKRLGFYGSYTYDHDRSYNQLSGGGTQDFPALGGAMDILFGSTTKPLENGHNVTGGLDIRLNPTWTVGGSVTYNNTTTHSASSNYSDYDILPDSLLTFSGNAVSVNRWNNTITSLYMEKKTGSGERLNVDVDWLYYNNDNPTNVQNSIVNKEGDQAATNDSLYSPLERGFSHTEIQVGVVKVDYTRQLNKNLKWETGMKGTYTRDLSASGIENEINGAWTTNTQTSNDVAMNEGIGAVYTSFNTQITSSLNLIAGARYEYSHTHLDNPHTGAGTVDRKLGALFPDIFLSKKVNDHTGWDLSYTERISRPSYNDLTSFIGYSDPVAVYTGNPLLKPTITYNLKGGMGYRGYSISLLLSRDNYPIARYQLTENPAGNLLYISPQNLAWQNNATLQVNLPLKVNNWWNMNYSFTGGWRQFKADYTLQPVEKAWFAWTGNFSEIFRLDQKTSLEVSGWFSSAFYNGVTALDGMGVVNTGLKKELKNNKGVFQLSVSDVFRTLSFVGYHGQVTPEVFSIVNHFDYNTESAKASIIKLTYTRSFGSSASKSPRKEGATDEEDRVRKN